MEKRIYVENAATTKLAPEVFEAMKPYLTEFFGNPSSIYEEARTAKKAIESAREQVASAIGAEPKEIYFTGSGSEADNWAIRSAAKTLKSKGNHIITSAVEHHAVLHTCQELEKNGFEVTYLPVDNTGKVKFGYIDKILERWHSEGIRTIDQARAENRKPAQAGAFSRPAADPNADRSYDLEAFERMTLYGNSQR